MSGQWGTVVSAVIALCVVILVVKGVVGRRRRRREADEIARRRAANPFTTKVFEVYAATPPDERQVWRLTEERHYMHLKRGGFLPTQARSAPHTDEDSRHSDRTS